MLLPTIDYFIDFYLPISLWPGLVAPKITLPYWDYLEIGWSQKYFNSSFLIANLLAIMKSHENFYLQYSGWFSLPIVLAIICNQVV